MSTEIITVVKGDGYHIDQVTTPAYGRTEFRVYEDGTAWPNGTKKTVIEVLVQEPEVRFQMPHSAEVSWPSTSDKRPALALRLAEALQLAAKEAERMNVSFAEDLTNDHFEDREPGSVLEDEWSAKHAEILGDLR